MTRTMTRLIRVAGAGALLATAALGAATSGAGAAGKDCTMPKNVPGVGGITYPDGGKHTDDINNRTYIGDNGSWIIFTDEKLDPGAPRQPGLPRVGVAPRPGGGVAQP
jgi:hypothetical protein